MQQGKGEFKSKVCIHIQRELRTHRTHYNQFSLAKGFFVSRGSKWDCIVQPLAQQRGGETPQRSWTRARDSTPACSIPLQIPLLHE